MSMEFEVNKMYKCYTCSIAATYEFEGASDGSEFSFEKKLAPCTSLEKNAEGSIQVLQEIRIDDKVRSCDYVFPFAETCWRSDNSLSIYPVYINPKVKRSYPHIKDFIDYNPELNEVWCCKIVFVNIK